MENEIERIALTYLGRKYEPGFRCLDFVRCVYAEAGLTVFPVTRNVRPEELANPPVGHVLFLKHRQASKERRCTHAVIIISGGRCIHNSYYFGKKVVVTPLDQILSLYEVAQC